MNYTYRVIIEPDGKYFHAYVPALPGCHTFGKTIPEAKKHVRQAIEAYVESLLMDGENVPKDESFETFETFETFRLNKQKQYA
ncbi:MAG: type II toxin-antitoxin system HicB family antitoxin [Patescibacteria group bacterium]